MQLGSDTYEVSRESRHRSGVNAIPAPTVLLASLVVLVLGSHTIHTTTKDVRVVSFPSPQPERAEETAWPSGNSFFPLLRRKAAAGLDLTLLVSPSRAGRGLSFRDH